MGWIRKKLAPPKLCTRNLLFPIYPRTFDSPPISAIRLQPASRITDEISDRSTFLLWLEILTNWSHKTVLKSYAAYWPECSCSTFGTILQDNKRFTVPMFNSRNTGVRIISYSHLFMNFWNIINPLKIIGTLDIWPLIQLKKHHLIFFK